MPDGVVLCVMVAAFRRRTLQRRKVQLERARQATQEHELTLFRKLLAKAKKTRCVESARGI